MNRGIHAKRDDFKPERAEVIRKGDEIYEQLGRHRVAEGVDPYPPKLSEWFESETDRRYEQFVEQRDSPVKLQFEDPLAGVTLVPGTWCEPLVGNVAGSSTYRSRPRTWRNSRYVGRVGDVLFFERFGGKIDPWTRGKIDSVYMRSPSDPYGNRVLRCELKDPDPKLLKLLEERAAKVADQAALNAKMREAAGS